MILVEKRKSHHLVFYKTIRCTMLLCRCFGLLPVSGIILKTSDSLRFSWTSPYFILIYMPSTLAIMTRVGLLICDILKHQMTLSRASNLIFASSTAASSILLLKLCWKWKNLVHAIEDIEEMLPPLKEAGKVVRLCNVCTAVIMLLGTVEHLLFLIFTYKTTLLCFTQPDDTGMFLRSYFVAVNAWFYEYVPFSYATGLAIQLQVIQTTFVWNFTDVLIMGFSIYLIAQFRSFNKTVINEEKKFIQGPNPQQFPWNELHIHFTRLTHLVDIIDRHINPFVFVSFSSNLFFICQQLFFLINENIRKDDVDIGTCEPGQTADWETTIYLFFSLGFLIVRTMSVSLLAAQIHKTSRESLFLVYSMPTSLYNSGMQRFTEQVYHCRVGLSGLNFFFVTRGLILTVAATVVTYELVLLQIQPKRNS